MSNNIYGIGISATSDFPQTMQIIGSTRIIVEALYRRFTTPNGALGFIGDSTNYGLDLTLMINDDLNSAKIAAWNAAIVSQCLLEEAIFSANSSIIFNADKSSAQVTITVSLNSGPTFQLVLSVSAVTAELLSGG